MSALVESIGRSYDPERVHYTAREAILYALSLGYGSDPLDPLHLKYVYENGLVALPTQACVLGHRSIREMDLGVDYRRVVHGGQKLVLFRPFAPEGMLISRTTIENVVDLGKDRGAVIHLLRTLRDDEGDVAESRMEILCRGDGGFAAEPAPRAILPPMPERPPDAVVTLATAPQAALLYRLNGDTNPLHADPVAARKAGFNRPILHGLATFGMAARAMLDFVKDERRIAAISGRFSAPVFPGETLATQFWRDGDDVRFRTSVAERGVIVLNHGTASVQKG